MGNFHGLARSKNRGLKTEAAQRSALLSLLFVIVYCGCNWITSRRADVGVLYFAWEHRLPFVPAMIVPYLSIDAFFVAAPFLCRDRAELDRFTRRVVAGILVAGACFLLLPLRFAFERPVVEGWPAPLFRAFSSLDRPFNLLPSLHITLGVLLADAYRRHTSGPVRVAVMGWFVLVGLSTLLTYQHHILDVAGGFVLAACIFTWVPDPQVAQESAGSGSHQPIRNMRIGSWYLLGTALLLAVAAATSPGGVGFLWSAFGLAASAAAYMGAGPNVFRKSSGRIPVSTWVIVWPGLLGQWLSLQYYERRFSRWDEISPRLWIGGRLSNRDAVDAVDRGVTAVLDLTAELSEAAAFKTAAYRNIPILDLTAPTTRQLTEAAAFIREQSSRGVTYVHCKIGCSRSAAAVGAYLLESGGARTTDEALAILRRARPGIVVRPESVAALRKFEASLTDHASRATLTLTFSPTGGERGRLVSAGTATRPPKRLREGRTPGGAPGALGSSVARLARFICGTDARWVGCTPSTRQRIYYANHTSHLDFLVLWGSLPAEVRAVTRPVAGSDYWSRGPLRRYMADRVFRAVLIDRQPSASGDHDRARIAAAGRSIQRTADALGNTASLVIFPEGTRGDGAAVAPFKSGLFHLCQLRPDVELVPVYLDNMYRILPKGELLPVPLRSSVTFGQPIHLRPGESKASFLERARGALVQVHHSCIGHSIATSPISSAA